MPIYEYQCQKCNTLTEVFQKLSDKPLAKCPKCGGRLEKLISASAIQFKGSGWYVTDYAGRSEKAPKSEGEGSSDDKAADKKADKKTKESSPASKSSSKASSSKVPSKD
jgi:putative FmdB family regulatory protein